MWQNILYLNFSLWHIGHIGQMLNELKELTRIYLIVILFEVLLYIASVLEELLVNY